MRIGIVSVSYLPRLGGAVTQALLLHRELTRRGHHVEIFCPDLSKSGRFDENGITVNRVTHRWIRGFDDNRSRLMMLWLLRQAVQRNVRNFDVFITAEFNIGALSLSLTRGTRKVGTYGADFAFEYVNITREKIVPYSNILRCDWSALGIKTGVVVTGLYAMQRYLLHRMDHNVVVNDMDLKRLSAITPNVSKIPFLQEPPVPNETWLRKPHDRPRILTVIARAVSWKGIPRALDLALGVKALFPDLEIHFYGTGPDLKRIEARYGHKVRIHKEMTNPQILAELEKSDITVNLSEYETFCLVNTEAMLRRSLLLVKPLAEYDYLTDGKNCLFVTEENFHAIPAQVQQLFGSPRLRTILDEAQTGIERMYPIERSVVALEQLFEQVAANRPVRIARSDNSLTDVRTP